MKTLPLVSALLFSSLAALAADGVKLTDADGRVRVEIGGQLFTEYHYRDTPRPVLYPVIGATGAGMTRNYPMKEVAGETKDHPHHRGIQWSHTRINEVTTWGESKARDGTPPGRTVHKKFLELSSGPKFGVIRSENQIVAGDGKPVCAEFLTIRFHDRGPARDLFPQLGALDIAWRHQQRAAHAGGVARHRGPGGHQQTAQAVGGQDNVGGIFTHRGIHHHLVQPGQPVAAPRAQPVVLLDQGVALLPDPAHLPMRRTAGLPARQDEHGG